MGETSMNKEVLPAIKHKETERKQAIKDQTAMNNSTKVFNDSQQQRASPLSTLASPYYNTIMKDQTTKILQGNNKGKKEYTMII